MKQSNPVLESFVNSFSKDSSFISFSELFSRSGSVSISGLTGFSFSLFLVAFFKKFRRSLLVVTNDSNESEYIRDDLDNFSIDSAVCFLPEPSRSSVLFSDIESTNAFFVNDALRNLSSDKPVVLVSTFESLNISFPALDIYRRFNRVYNINDTIDRDNFINTLVGFGYESVDMVDIPLTFCIKGGVLDFFPPDSLLPYRLEFFGDVLESIRMFNPDSQLTVNTVSSFSFQPPVTNLSVSNPTTDVFTYLKNDTVVFCLHADSVFGTPNSTPKSIVYKLLPFSRIDHFDLLSPDISFSISTPEHLRDIADFKNYLLSFVRPDLQVAIFCSDVSHIERLKILLDLENILYFGFPISSGFEMPSSGLYLYTEHELFKRPRKVNFFNKYARDYQIDKINPRDVASGDLMVHINYGVGRYIGLTKILAFGSMRECLVIEYLGGDRVFVPLEKLNYVQKYIGNADSHPPLNKLGTSDWERTKLKTRKALDSISKELLDLYAKRISSPGFAFAADSDLQFQMESDFLYYETPDQLTAIREVKEDMERARPMDRLLCGDVGFGKTEVAIRASFKAVLNSKQVAILVPTTILADQHFSVFSKRFSNYPVKVALLSRFVSRKQQNQIIKDLSSGNVDIVIGTHRLLSNDISFKDLGLLIIDEEHRFGVKDKERIKLLRESIDVLALSATPIPRSLHFSLIGARDFSVINTPPISRLPVITDVIVFDINIIKNAIMREINRGGQVFFVHNNVQTIAALCQKLSRLLPDVSIAFAHGQMNERDLEKIMSAFIYNQISILVTTTIIESGIDIANANTIFINNAHLYGLAQLYQLRGRVGRSNRRAYAYLIVPEPSRIKPDALRKLQTIKKYTALGSGYNVALQDLEIRGAGNLFGSSQSGNIEAIGYELYMKFLRESLDENNLNRSDTSKNVAVETEIFCPWPAFFPDNFIPDPANRLEYYRQLSAAKHLSDIDRIYDIVRDIYGKLPYEAITLLEISKIRVLSAALFIKKVTISETSVHFLWDDSFSPPSGAQFLSAIKQASDNLKLSYKFNPHAMLHLTLFLPDSNQMEKIICFLNLLLGSFNL